MSTMTGTSFIPSFSAASRRAWPAMISSSAPTRIGFVHPHSRIEAAMLATCARLCVRGLFDPRNQSFDRPALDLDVDVHRSLGTRFCRQARL